MCNECDAVSCRDTASHSLHIHTHVVSRIMSVMQCHDMTHIHVVSRMFTLQCAAVCCCSVLQRVVAQCCSALQCVAVCCSVMQCVAVCCSVLQCVAKT